MIFKLLILSLAVWQTSSLQGGQPAPITQFPSFVGVFLPTATTICGGAILNVNHVLTLANCMLNANNQLLPTFQVSVLAGSNQLNFGLPRIQSQAIYVHPHFNPFTFENNIAVIRMASGFIFPDVPVPAVQPAIISDRIAFDTMQCNLAAWNRNTSMLQTLTVPILNRDMCTELPVNFGRITETMICAGQVAAGPGVCAHNIGAILYCNNMLEGILTSGFGCGAVNNPGIYTQSRLYSAWIQEQIRRQDIPAANSFPLERLP